MCRFTQGQNISFYLSIRKPQRPGKPYFPGLWGMCAKNFCFSHTGKSQESMKYFILAFHAFPGFSGIEFCTIPRNRGILESWESIPGFSRFFKHKEKPGKRGIFIPGSPCFSRLFGLAFHAFQETVESWKARKAGNHSWLSALFCT